MNTKKKHLSTSKNLKDQCNIYSTIKKITIPPILVVEIIELFIDSSTKHAYTQMTLLRSQSCRRGIFYGLDGKNFNKPPP